MCAACDDDYYRDSASLEEPCTECSGMFAHIAYLSMLVVGGLAVASFLVHKNLWFSKALKMRLLEKQKLEEMREMKEKAGGRVLGAAVGVKEAAVGVNERNKISMIRRLMLSHLQVNSFLYFIEFKPPSGGINCIEILNIPVFT